MEQAPTVFADDSQADDFPDPGRARQRDLLLSVGVWQRGRDHLAGVYKSCGQYNRPVLARRHQVQLVTDPLPTFKGQRKKLAELLVVDLPVGVHELQQTGKNLLDASHISARYPGLGRRKYPSIGNGS